MAYFEEDSEAMVALEAMVDRAGLPNVLWALAHIARAKRDHVAETWQDQQLANAWQRRANYLDKAASTQILHD